MFTVPQREGERGKLCLRRHYRRRRFETDGCFHDYVSKQNRADEIIEKKRTTGTPEIDGRLEHGFDEELVTCSHSNHVNILAEAQASAS